MAYYITVSNQDITGVYSSDSSVPIPAGAIEVTLADVQMLDQHPVGFTGYKYANGTFTLAITPESIILKRTQAAALDAIDVLAGQKRAQFITTTPGQSDVYVAKYNDAVNYISTPNPNIADFPFVNAEATAFGITPLEAANTIIITRNQWVALGAQIELLRMTAKVNVGKAVNVDDVNRIVENLQTSLRGVGV